MKVRVIPILLITLDKILKNLEMRLEELEIHERVEAV